jgi:hypothetical protein
MNYFMTYNFELLLIINSYQLEHNNVNPKHRRRQTIKAKINITMHVRNPIMELRVKPNLIQILTSLNHKANIGKPFI